MNVSKSRVNMFWRGAAWADRVSKSGMFVSRLLTAQTSLSFGILKRAAAAHARSMEASGFWEKPLKHMNPHVLPEIAYRGNTYSVTPA